MADPGPHSENLFLLLHSRASGLVNHPVLIWKTGASWKAQAPSNLLHLDKSTTWGFPFGGGLNMPQPLYLLTPILE